MFDVLTSRKDSPRLGYKVMNFHPFGYQAVAIISSLSFVENQTQQVAAAI